MTITLIALGLMMSLASFLVAGLSLTPLQVLKDLAYSSATYRKGHIDTLVRQLQLRGMLFYIIAISTLVLATAFIGVGVYIFLSATSAFNGIVPDAPSGILHEKARTRAEVSRMLQDTADAKSRLEVGKDGYDILRPLAAISSLTSQRLTVAKLINERQSLEDVYYVIRAIVTQEQATVRLVSTYLGMTVPDRKYFDAKSIDSIREKLSQYGMNLISAPAVLRHISTLRERIPAIDSMPADNYEDDIANFGQIVREVNVIYQSLRDSLEAEFAIAKQQQRELDRDASQRQEALRLREDQLLILDEQLAAAEKASAQANVIVWLPNLTIRIGTVALLVFLTQIFHSTYRYTSEVATHYLSVASSLQLVAKGPKGIDAEQAVKLMDMLSTKVYRLEKVESPDLSAVVPKLSK